MLSVLTISLTKVLHYNPSVSFADSSPYTGEPLTRTASTRVPQNDTERRRAKTTTHMLHTAQPPALRANKIPAAWQRVLCNKKEERKMKKTFD